MYTITQIEDAIIADLKASALNGYCKKIDTFQLEGADEEEQIRLFAKQLPCVLIVFSEADINGFPNKRLEMPMKFQIMLASGSLRSEGESRRGTVGTYQMIFDLIFGESALTGKRLGLEIDPLMPTRVTAIVNTKGFSAYSVEFKTKAAHTF